MKGGLELELAAADAAATTPGAKRTKQWAIEPGVTVWQCREIRGVAERRITCVKRWWKLEQCYDNDKINQLTLCKANDDTKDVKTYEILKKKSRKMMRLVRRWSCGWSGATTNTQQRSERWNKKTTNPSNFRSNNHENEEFFTATLWLERRFNNDTGVRNRRKNRLEMFVRTGRDNDVMMWNWRWAECMITNVGITNCRWQINDTHQ